MKSTEKVYAMLEVLQNEEDEDIREALPIGAPPMIRGALVAVARYLPQDPGELDGFLTEVGNFCHAMRSDDAGGQALDQVALPAIAAADE